MTKRETTKFTFETYFRLDDYSRQLMSWLLPIVKASKPTTIKKKPGESAYFALAYELLRFVRSSAFDRNMRPTNSPEGYEADRENWTPHLSTTNTTLTRLFSNDANFHLLLKSLRAFGASESAISEVEAVGKQASTAMRKRRWEISAHNIHDPGVNQYSVPREFTKLSKPLYFRLGFFLLRWSIIVEHAFQESAASSHEWYRNIAEGVRGKGSMLLEVGDIKTLSLYLNEVLPELTSTEKKRKEKQSTQDEKRRSQVDRLWALEFMHADYARLIIWGNWDKDKPPFLSDFIANRLGPFVLYAKHKRGWSWKKPDEWQELLMSKRRPSTIPTELDDGDKIPIGQPVQIGDRHFAFEYFKKIDSERAKSLIKTLVEENAGNFFSRSEGEG